MLEASDESRVASAWLQIFNDPPLKQTQVALNLNKVLGTRKLGFRQLSLVTGMESPIPVTLPFAAHVASSPVLCRVLVAN